MNVKRQLTRSFLLLFCSIVLGLGNVDDVALGNCIYTESCSIQEGFDGDLSFDALIGSMHMALFSVPCYSITLYGCTILRGERYGCWRNSTLACALPLRAPPIIG